MILVAGIDGGQSSTAAALVDETGRVLARGSAGPCDHVDEPATSRRFAHAVEDALADAMRAAQLPVGTTLDAVVAGISGYEGAIHGVAPTLPARAVRYVHDAPIALAGALAGASGIMVLSGTGSVVYGEAGGRVAWGGGWGYLFGDEGSSFALARAAIAAAMAASDRGERTPLGDAALAYFALPDLRALARAVATRELGRPYLATFARVVCDAARLGSAEALAIVRSGAHDLAALAAQIATRLKLTEGHAVALVGGTFGSATYRDAVRHALAERLPLAECVATRYDPVLGAALLALRDAGVEAPPDLLEENR